MCIILILNLLELEVLKCVCDVVKDMGKGDQLRLFVRVGLDLTLAVTQTGISTHTPAWMRT